MCTERRKLFYKMLLFCSGLIFLLTCCRPVKSEGTVLYDTDTVKEEAEKTAVAVWFLRAGKADSILVYTANHAYLIDTGKETSLPSIFGALHMLHIEKLDAVFCTHTHNDHIGGLKGVLQGISVDTVYRSEISEENKKGINKIDKKAERETVTLKVGDRIPVEDGIQFEVMGPIVQNTEDDNDNSLVLKLKTGETSYLFTGDMQFAEEQTLLDSHADLKADVLKIGNHGNPDATGETFAKAVDPKYCVVTTDRTEDEDSANPAVLAHFPNAEIYCTDETEQGVLFIQTETGKLSVLYPLQTGNGDFSGLSLTRTERTLVFENRGNDTELSSCMISTESGDGFFCFPNGTVLKRGESVTVSGQKDDGDYIVSGKKPFSDKNGKLLLFDEYGNCVRSFG